MNRNASDRRQPVQSKRRMRLSCETLECRLTPAFYEWNGQVAGALWSNPGNWLQPAGQQVAAAPGVNDTAFFSGNSVRDVVVDTSKVANLSITSLYTGTLSLGNGGLEVTDKFEMNNGTITAGTGNEASLKLDGLNPPAGVSGNTLAGGTLSKLFVYLGRASDDTVTKSVIAAGSVGITLKDTSLKVTKGDRLNWVSGDIGMGGAACFIFNDGMTEFNASAKLGGAAIFKQLWNGADGTLIVNQSPEVSADFTNDGGFTVSSGANAKLSGLAVQTGIGATTKLKGGTITLSGTGEVYQCSAGTFTGYGTVAGNLVIGTPDNPPVYFDVGGDAAASRTSVLIVDKSIHIKSGIALTTFNIDGDEASKVVVNAGYAHVNGTVSFNIFAAPTAAHYPLIDVRGGEAIRGAFSNQAAPSAAANNMAGYLFRYNGKAGTPGGDENDVVLDKQVQLSGVFWDDRDFDKAWGQNIPWYGSETGLAGVKVTLLGDHLAAPLATVTSAGGAYSFSGLIPGAYTVVFEAPDSPVGYTVTTVPGFVGYSGGQVSVTLDGTSGFVVGPIGMAMPKMRVTITASGSSPLAGQITGTFDLLFMGDTGTDRYWDYYFPGSAGGPGAAIIELRVTDGTDDGGYVVPGGQATVYLADFQDHSWFYSGSGFTTAAGGSATTYWPGLHPDCTVPVTLTFTAIFPS